jgi:lambda family phage portal protein
MLAANQVASAHAFLGQLSNVAKQRDRERAISVQVLNGSQEAYRWAQINGRTKDFQPPHRSGNAAIYESDDLMGRRVRNQQLNVAQVKCIIDAFQDLIVGCGMQTFSDPLSTGITVDELLAGDFEDELNHALEADDLHDEWFNDAKRFCVRRKIAGPEFQRLAIKECVTAGSSLILECMKKNRRTGEPELCYQLIEREQLDRSKDRPASPTQNKIINGIEFNEDDEEVAFHVFEAHPYDDFSPFTGGSSKSTRLPAERVIHLVLFSRPSDFIGVNWLHATAQNQFDRFNFIGNEIATAAKAALLLLIYKFEHLKAGSAGLGLTDDGDIVDEFGNPEVKMSQSPLAQVVGVKDEVELLESNRPISTAESFIGILDRDTAGGVGLSPLTVHGDWSKTNFSSGRGAQLKEDLHIRPLQNWFGREAAIPMRQRYHELAILGRKLKHVGVQDYLANRRRYDRFDAIGGGREWLDPVAEAESTLAELRAGLSTLKLKCARRGLHWIRVLRQLAWEMRVSQKLGLVLDFSKGQGSRAEQSTSDGSTSAPEKRREPAPKKAKAKNRRAG